MNKSTVISSLIAFGLVASLGLASCTTNEDSTNTTTAQGSQEASGSSLVVMLQKTQTAPSYVTSFANTYIKNAQSSKDQFQLVVLDGDPYIALDSAVTLGSGNPNSENAAAEEQTQLAQIQSCMYEATGKTDGVDIMSALALADRAHASSATGSGTTVIAASGLSVTGALDLSGEGMLTVESDTVVAYLKNYGYDLSHTKQIIWYGLGDVAGDQERLTPVVKKSLQTMYEAALVELGVEEVVFKDEPVASTTETNDSQPSAKLIDIPNVEPLQIPTDEAVKLDCETLPFIAGTADLVDPSSASTTIAPFVEAMKSSPTLTCEVAGSTASYPWDPTYAYELGLERAQTVKDLMVSAGIDESRITTKSYGDDAKNHIDDIDESTGLQIPELAQQNRWTSLQLV